MPLRAPEDILYRSVYTLFAAMPWRLAPGTTFFVATHDVAGGVELTWEGREEAGLGAEGFRDVLRMGPHGDLVDIAFSALERFCAARAGEAQTALTVLQSSPRMPRRDVVIRRVRIFIPAPSEPASEESNLAAAEG